MNAVYLCFEKHKKSIVKCVIGLLGYLWLYAMLYILCEDSRQKEVLSYVLLFSKPKI